MAISKSKRRYSVSLTPANVLRLQAIMAKIGLPPATMSHFIDDQLPTLAATFEGYHAKGCQMNLAEIITLMGQQMQLLDEKEAIKNDQQKIQGSEKKAVAR